MFEVLGQTMSTPANHLARTNGYTACGWDTSRVNTTTHHDRVTCKLCLRVIGAIHPRRSDQRADVRRGGTNTGLGKMLCAAPMCGKPYSLHKNFDDHGGTR